jgi:WD40 repeat protein
MTHRDIKPHNLMVTPAGQIKILDFGLALFAREAGAESDGLTSQGVVMGTADYMAPEQASDSHHADIRADIYSLGCTLYHLLTGCVPFPKGTFLDKVVRHATKEPTPMSQFRPELPSELVCVVERMMAKQPEQRYQTPAEVAQALALFAKSSAAPASMTPDPAAALFSALSPSQKEIESLPQTIHRSHGAPGSAVHPRHRWHPSPVIALTLLVLLLGGLIVGATAIYRIQTDKGELVIETDNDDVEVLVRKNGDVVKIIDVKSGKHVTLNSGDYELSLKDGQKGLRLSPGKMTLKRGEIVLATITRETKPVAETVSEVRCFRGHQACVHCVAISPDGRLAASGAGGLCLGPSNWVHAPDYAVRLWDMASGRELRRFEGHGSSVTGLAFSPDGSLLASAGSHDQTVRIWGVATGKELHCLRGHNGRANRLAFLPDGRYVVSGGHDRLLRVWDVNTGKQVRKFEGHEGPVQGIAVSPDGRLIASGGEDRTARVWEVKTGKELRQFPGHTQNVHSVAFSPDGSRLLSTDSDSNNLRLWDVENSKELRRFVGHTGSVGFVVFTPDGRWALSSSGDEMIRLWDVETGKELHRFTGHTSHTTELAVSPDGRYILSGSNDKTVRLWRLPDPPPKK